MQFIKQNKKFIFFYTLIFLIPVFFAFLLNGVFVFGDDVYQLFFDNKKLLDFITNVDHGCLVSVFFLKFIGSFVPMHLGLHPANNYIGILFRGTNFALIIFLLNKFLTFYIKDKTVKISCYFFITFVFAAFFAGFDSAGAYNCFYVLSKHCRYVFSMIPYLSFWYLLYRIFITEKPLNKALFITFVISALWLGVSVEAANISSFCSLILFLLFTYKLYGKDKFKSYFFSKKNLFLYSLFGLGLFFVFTNQGFTNIAEHRGLHSALFNITKYYPEFLVAWVKAVFVSNHFLILTILNLFLSGFIFKKNKGNEEAIKTVFFAWCLIFGISCFQLSLLSLGKTYYLEGKFWIDAGTLRFDTLVVQLSAFCILLGKSLSLKKSGEAKNLLKNVSVIAFVLFFITLTFGKSIVGWNIHLIVNKQILYKAEKMYLFYASKNQTAILSSDILKSSFCKEFLGIKGWERPGYITVLYPALYGISPNNFVIVPDNVAMAIFAKQGGSLTKTEIEKSDFNKLLKEYSR